MMPLKIVVFNGYFNLQNMYVHITVSGGQKFVQRVLICSIVMQNADFMSKLSKMIKYCHFSVAETVRSYIHL